MTRRRACAFIAAAITAATFMTAAPRASAVPPAPDRGLPVAAAHLIELNDQTPAVLPGLWFFASCWD